MLTGGVLQLGTTPRTRQFFMGENENTSNGLRSVGGRSGSAGAQRNSRSPPLVEQAPN